MKPFAPLAIGISLLISIVSCDSNDNPLFVNPSDDLALDSLKANKRTALLWEEVTITAYTRGENIHFQWSANHGSLLSTDSSSVIYWGCPSCVGKNIIQCIAENEFGAVQDTILIEVLNEE